LPAFGWTSAAFHSSPPTPTWAGSVWERRWCCFDRSRGLARESGGLASFGSCSSLGWSPAAEQLARFDGSPRDAEALFDLLSDRAKKNLRARAERYGAASGRKIAPSAMLVPSRTAPHFTPQSYRAQISGAYAMVEVAGVGADERAEMPCVLEEGAWRVDLVLPELPPMRQRPGGER
jgi:hypothetical protein